MPLTRANPPLGTRERPMSRRKWPRPAMLLGTAGLQRYTDRVLGYNPVAYFPFNEESGIVARCLVDPAQNGTYTGVTLANDATGPFGTPAPRYDGANDLCGVYSAALAAVFDGAEGSLAIWGKVVNAGIWTDNTYHFQCVFGQNANNRAQVLKGSNVEANELVGTRIGGAGVVSTDTVATTTTDWFLHSITWSETADEFKCYLDGVQYGVTQVGLGGYVGALANTFCYIGQYNGPAFKWNGWLGPCAVWDRVLPQATITALANP